ncbi:MAG: alpha-1-antitrypsin, partial [Rhodopirellula bahusiensis]
VWARQRIRQIWNRDVGAETPAGRAEITELGLKHQLMTQYTSFIAVEKELSEAPQGQLITESVPVMTPEGMTQEAAGRSVAAAKPALQHQASTNSTPAVPAAAAPATVSTPAPASTPSPAPRSSGGNYGGGGGGGGGPIGPITGIVSLGGAAAAMMRRRKTRSNKQDVVR